MSKTNSTDQKVNSMDLKRINRKKTFDFLSKSEPQSKQDIAYALKMSIPTIAQNIRELHAQNLIMNAGMLDSTGGRKAQAVVFNPDAKLAVGLDVTRNHITCVVVNLGGTLLVQKRIKYPFGDTSEYYEQTAALVEQVLSDANADRSQLLGVGIAVPAIVSEDGERMTYSPVLGMDKGELKKFAQYIEYPCMFYNDANSAGFAEIWSRGIEDDYIIYIAQQQRRRQHYLQGQSVPGRQSACRRVWTHDYSA